MSTADVGTDKLEAAPRNTAVPSLFVRQSSGLIRAFSLRDVLVFNFSNINFGLSFSFGTLSVALLLPGC